MIDEALLYIVAVGAAATNATVGAVSEALILTPAVMLVEAEGALLKVKLQISHGTGIESIRTGNRRIGLQPLSSVIYNVTFTVNTQCPGTTVKTAAGTIFKNEKAFTVDRQIEVIGGKLHRPLAELLGDPGNTDTTA